MARWGDKHQQADRLLCIVRSFHVRTLATPVRHIVTHALLTLTQDVRLTGFVPEAPVHGRIQPAKTVTDG
jgi:hypothetical protein